MLRHVGSNELFWVIVFVLSCIFGAALLLVSTILGVILGF